MSLFTQFGAKNSSTNNYSTKKSANYASQVVKNIANIKNPSRYSSYTARPRGSYGPNRGGGLYPSSNIKMSPSGSAGYGLGSSTFPGFGGTSQGIGMMTPFPFAQDAGGGNNLPGQLDLSGLGNTGGNSFGGIDPLGINHPFGQYTQNMGANYQAQSSWLQQLLGQQMRPATSDDSDRILQGYLRMQGLGTGQDSITAPWDQTNPLLDFSRLIGQGDVRGDNDFDYGAYGEYLRQLQGDDQQNNEDFNFTEDDFFPEVPYQDPWEQAQQWADWQRSQRIANVNRMIDQRIEGLGLEKGRVPEYYNALRASMGTNREAALSGSTAALTGINKGYTQNRLSMSDMRDKYRQDATSMLMQRGTLDSGQADRVYKDIDNIISRNVTDVMKQKDIKVADIMEGKSSVQQAFTTALTNADKEEKDYLIGLDKEIQNAETQRGSEIFNIGEELSRYVPVMARNLQTDQYGRQMQNAVQRFNAQLAMGGVGSGGRGGTGGFQGVQPGSQLDLNWQKWLATQNQPQQQDYDNQLEAQGLFLNRMLTDPNSIGMFDQYMPESYMTGSLGISPEEIGQWMQSAQRYNDRNIQDQFMQSGSLPGKGGLGSYLSPSAWYNRLSLLDIPGGFLGGNDMQDLISNWAQQQGKPYYGGLYEKE